ncbi:MAG: hypothetical protein CMK89_16065 [Pseudomonadales bacterium]|nr:hypothetical protein [Pseudomonadales bacterium]
MVKKKTYLALLPLTLCFSSVSVLAATTADLEKRLEQQEKQIKRLENRLKGTRAAVKENRSRISDAADRLKINGFFSGGAAQMDSPTMELSLYGIEDNYTTDSVSKMGVQFTFEVSDSIDATAQLVSKGVNDYNVEAEWAYLSWEATSDLTVRIGRQRIPYYLLSEYLDVGYAYPWVRPPIELYNIPLSSTDGLGLLYDFSLGDWNFSVQGYAGQSSGFTDQLEADFILNQAWGTSLFAEHGAWTFRVGYNRSHLDVGDVPIGGKGYLLAAATDGYNDFSQSLENGTTGNAALDPLAGLFTGLGRQVPTVNNMTDDTNVKTEYQSAAFMYDDGNLLVMGEIANLRIEDLSAPAGDGGYLTVGYRFGKWMPHVTFAKYYTDKESDDNVRSQLEGSLGLQQGVFDAVYAQTLIGTGNPAVAQATAQGTVDSVVAGLASQGLVLQEFQEAWTTLIQQQQSYTLGIVYDVSPRVKAKLEATHYEDFGKSEIESTSYTGNPAAPTNATPTIAREIYGTGRFSADPVGSGKKHTAIYSFSIDAVF